MKDDLIDRQAALKHIEKIRQAALMMDDIYRESIVMNGMHLCEEAVRNQPTAEPERKTGRWIHDGSRWQNRWVCSECGYKWFFDTARGMYCPNCGAKMDEREE